MLGVTGGSPDSVANLASTVCSKLNSGVSEGDLIAAVATDHPGSMYTAQAAIHAVEWHFCPDYY